MTAIDGSETAPAALDGRLQAFRSRALSRRQLRARATTSLLLACFDLVMVAMIVAGARGPARVGVGLAFCLVVPGWSIVGPLRLNRPPLELGLTVGAGLAALMVVAQLAATFSAWHLTTVQLVVCAACLPSLVWQSLALRGPLEGER